MPQVSSSINGLYPLRSRAVYSCSLLFDAGVRWRMAETSGLCLWLPTPHIDGLLMWPCKDFMKIQTFFCALASQDVLSAICFHWQSFHFMYTLCHKQLTCHIRHQQLSSIPYVSWFSLIIQHGHLPLQLHFIIAPSCPLFVRELAALGRISMSVFLCRLPCVCVYGGVLWYIWHLYPHCHLCHQIHQDLLADRRWWVLALHNILGERCARSLLRFRELLTGHDFPGKGAAVLFFSNGKPDNMQNMSEMLQRYGQWRSFSPGNINVKPGSHLC